MSWAPTRLKWLATEVRLTVDLASLNADEVFHYSIPSLDEFGDGAVEPIADIGSNKLLLQGGEVLVSKLNPRINRVFTASRHSVPTVASTEFIALQPGQDLDSRFLSYVLQSEASRQFLDGATMSVTRSQQRVRPEVLTGWWLSVPALPMQRRIADYLDRETTRIDALMAAKRRMVDLLAERWQTVMYDAVAGRLTADMKRRPTSLPWLADVPVHWREGLLKLVAKLGTGHTPSRSHPEWWLNPIIPWITTGEVAQMRADQVEYITETRERISTVGIANSSAEIHPAGTVVLCRTASAGYSAIMATEMATSQDFATWTCGPLLRPRYLLLCLRAMRQDLLGRLAMGSTHKTIYMPDIESIKVPIPPLCEQDELVDAAYEEFSPLDSARRNIEVQLPLLEERRQAIITAAVTGRLKLESAA
jgi:type I restriction enzyme S subunit